MALHIDEIIKLYRTAGAARYGMEAINQEQHALQCGQLAEQAGSPPTLVAAALLHDLGHLLATVQKSEGPRKNDLHEYVAIPFLRGLFPDAVIEPIRLHVKAKRYLCAVEPSYWASLSSASQRSLVLQGGPFTADEAQAFIQQPFGADAIALRIWDDRAKNPDVTTPGWTHFQAALGRVSAVSA